MKAVLLFFFAITSASLLSQEVNKTVGPDAGKIIFDETSKPEQEIEVYAYAEERPYFGDEASAMYQYFAEEIAYPNAAIKAGIEGKVFVQFIVRKDGSISDAQVLKGIGGGCDEEVLRIINAMPAWNPGKQNGQAVNVMYRVPIQFNLPGQSTK